MGSVPIQLVKALFTTKVDTHCSLHTALEESSQESGIVLAEQGQ